MGGIILIYLLRSPVPEGILLQVPTELYLAVSFCKDTPFEIRIYLLLTIL